MKNGTVPRPVTAGQLKEIVATVVEAIPSNITFDAAKFLIGKKKRLGNKIREVFQSLANVIDSQIQEWEEFYQQVFGMTVDFSKLIIPQKSEGFDRLIVIAQGITPERIFQKCRELFGAWKFYGDSLDQVIVHSDRTAVKGAYAIWVRDRIEADEELKDLSANDLKARGVPGTTFEERGLYELKYWKETGRHLDIQNLTLCSGSRYSDGGVPSVDWGGVDRKMNVSGCYSDNHYGCLRSRQVVS